MSFKSWLALLGLSASAFIFNTSEFIPIGLLTHIASDFSITEAHAGMLISSSLRLGWLECCYHCTR